MGTTVSWGLKEAWSKESGAHPMPISWASRSGLGDRERDKEMRSRLGKPSEMTTHP
jgi:hypothetical protein